MVAFVERQNRKIAELSQRLDDLLEQAMALLSPDLASQKWDSRCSNVACNVANTYGDMVKQSF